MVLGLLLWHLFCDFGEISNLPTFKYLLHIGGFWGKKIKTYLKCFWSSGKYRAESHSINKFILVYKIDGCKNAVFF